MFADEDLKQLLQETSGALAELTGRDRPLTDEEKKHRARLSRRKQALDLIAEARRHNRKDAELFHTSVYNLLVPWGENHPVLMFFALAMMRMKWGTGSFIRLH